LLLSFVFRRETAETEEGADIELWPNLRADYIDAWFNTFAQAQKNYGCVGFFET